MVEHTFSDEAEFIYSLLLEHYDNGEIDDPAVLIESEEYKHTINIDAFEYGLNEFLKQSYFEVRRLYRRVFWYKASTQVRKYVKIRTENFE